MTPNDRQLAAGERDQPAGTGRAGDTRVDFELRFLRQLRTFGGQFKKGQDVARVTRAALKAGMELLGAKDGCVAILPPGSRQVEVVFLTPPGADWDKEMLTAFIRGSEQRIPAQLALGRLHRRDRMWGVLAVRSQAEPFHWGHREALSAFAAAASEVLGRIDLERVQEVRGRLFARCWLRPKDLFYQVLHGLHSLTQYDHSASLLIYEPAANTLEVVAETITWKKGKSDRVGMKLPVPEAVLKLLAPGLVYGFNRPEETWEEWTKHEAASLAQFLDSHDAAGAAGDEPLDRGMLCAPLATPDRILGLLKVAARRPRAFGPYETELVEQFLPHVAIALQNTQRTETLEKGLLQAERKHAMADLARGVAHDVNNALGAVLPLVQQMQAEITAGERDQVSVAEDLRQIETSMQTCRRIFGGMLSFARGVQPSSGANIRQAIDNTRAIFKENLERHGIQVAVDVQTGLHSIQGSQAELEQLFLNLVTNSRDAMPDGGKLSITARRAEDAIQLVVADTGVGIPPENLAKVEEPFFSTKPEGNGLGLSICRSIVWQLRGRFDISSKVGEGTRVTVTIPIAPVGES